MERNGTHADEDDHRRPRFGLEFSDVNRQKVIRYLLRNSILMEKYDVAFEITHTFIKEMHLMTRLPVLENLHT